VVEKRKHTRVDVHFQLCCRPAGENSGEFCHGRAVNASPGGLYFKTPNCKCHHGKIVEIELAIGPKSGQLERLGRISSFAKVVRTEHVGPENTKTDASQTAYGVAVEFCRSPKLTT
jgi:hypothetical protein